MSEPLEVRPVSFPAEILARIAPDLSIQRHLWLGLRPCLRSFTEFRDVSISEGGISRPLRSVTGATENDILGSNVLKSGSTIVITSITGGMVEETQPATGFDEGEQELRQMSLASDRLAKYGAVYPVVEVERGRLGAPTDEEMILSQRIHDNIISSGIIPKESLKVPVGVRSRNEDGTSEIFYSGDETGGADTRNFNLKRQWSFVLYAKIQVFSRDGPLFEMCWNSLMYALQRTLLPCAFVDERTTDLKIPVRVRGRSATIRETYDIQCDPTEFKPLKLNLGNISYGSNFGVIDLDPEAQVRQTDNEMEVDSPTSVLIADLQGEAEETSIKSTLSILTDGNGKLKHLSFVGGGAKIDTDAIRKSLSLSRERALDLKSRKEAT
ncbi:LAMI_0G07690g1_1 [Lachancea mirantina]|uniref:Ribosomal RNA-processing protein 43 n=1 Tax=Lachancea mirantina TaxID=1230905 RepID=A0A1G4K9M5_9SACH|nr:LAMI_0G07690g1_1 [Lachancea mirantina]